MAPRDDKKKSGLACGLCLVIVVVVEAVVGICRGRQGGGHRVKTREDPPSGARTLIDFPTSLVPLSSVESSLPPKVIHAHVAFGLCSFGFSSHVVLSRLSRCSRDQMVDDFLQSFYANVGRPRCFFSARKRSPK